MIDARNDAANAGRSPHGDDARAVSPERALLTLWNALRHATLVLGEQALAQQGEAALRADAVVAVGVTRLKTHLSAAGDGPHASEATMTESTDNDDTAATPNADRTASPGANPNSGARSSVSASAAASAAGADAAPIEPEELLERLRAALAGSGGEGSGGEPYRYSGVSQQIESAVKQSNETVLNAAGDFAYGHRAATDAFATGLRKISDAQHRQNLQTLQAAAMAVCLDAMIKQPHQADEYAGLLEEIKHIV